MSDAGGEVANQLVHMPLILPKVPGRFYYYFGKPLETEGRKQELGDDRPKSKLYLQVKSEVERCIAYLKVKRGIGPRLLYQATHGFESEEAIIVVGETWSSTSIDEPCNELWHDLHQHPLLEPFKYSKAHSPNLIVDLLGCDPKDMRDDTERVLHVKQSMGRTKYDSP
ncbi:hypothetical protein JHK84_049951 [Glycine max]|nr:hypothetical protein JHK86_049905 [Glycine max]KAG5094363.1 hypothetical protein JHK84_049951 [Glycine max]